MGMIKRILAVGALATAMTTGVVQAATVSINGTIDPPGPGVNNFAAALNTALGGSAVLLGPATITTVGPVRLTFTLVAAESGYANTFTANGAGILNEGANNNVSCGNLLTCGIGASISGIYSGSLTNQLFFKNNLVGYGALNVTLGHKAFGVFTKGGVGNHSVFFLAFDDQKKNPDDNHDDSIIRVEVAAVPVPAAGFLLIGALGGLVALRRRKTA